MHLIIPIGPAGCGKSTWIKDHTPKNENSLRAWVISPDQVRFDHLNSSETGIYFDEKREPEIWKYIWANLEYTVRRFETEYFDPTFFDATNLSKVRRYEIIKHVYNYTKQKPRISMVWFKTSLATCLERNALRTRKVPEAVIAKQFLALEPPEPWEYDQLEVVD